jgi:hypothetical protein
MTKYNWSDYTDEDVQGEIDFIKVAMKFLEERKISDAQKQKIADDYLDKLNTLYNEQRKRGTFKSSLD